MAREQEPVPRQVVAEAVTAALANAGRLLSDARILLDRGSPPTALAIATLAIEEAIKAVHYGVHATETTDATLLLPPTTHASRLLAARRVEGFVTDFVQLLAALARNPASVDLDGGPTEDELVEQQRRDNARKQRGFYVDADADGLHLPTEIQLDEASQAVERAALAVAAAEALLGSP